MYGYRLTYSRLKGSTFKLCVLNRWYFNFCICSSTLQSFTLTYWWTNIDYCKEKVSCKKGDGKNNNASWPFYRSEFPLCRYRKCLYVAQPAAWDWRRCPTPPPAPPLVPASPPLIAAALPSTWGPANLATRAHHSQSATEFEDWDGAYCYSPLKTVYLGWAGALCLQSAVVLVPRVGWGTLLTICWRLCTQDGDSFLRACTCLGHTAERFVLKVGWGILNSPLKSLYSGWGGAYSLQSPEEFVLSVGWGHTPY